MLNISFKPPRVRCQTYSLTPHALSLVDCKNINMADMIRQGFTAFSVFDVGPVLLETGQDTFDVPGTDTKVTVTYPLWGLRGTFEQTHRVLSNLPPYIRQSVIMELQTGPDGETVKINSCPAISPNIPYLIDLAIQDAQRVYEISARDRQMDGSLRAQGPVVMPQGLVPYGVHAMLDSFTSRQRFEEMLWHMMTLVADRKSTDQAVYGSNIHEGATSKIKAAVYDSERPWVSWENVKASRTSPEGATLHSTLMRQHGSPFYHDRFDNAFTTPATAAALKAFRKGKGFEADLVVTSNEDDQPTGRRAVMLDDPPLPFAREWFHIPTNYVRAPGLLTLATTPGGQFSCVDGDKLHSDTEQWDRDRVYIHRANGVTRFLFVDHIDAGVSPTFLIMCSVFLPVAITDDECASQASLPPVRGLNPVLRDAMLSTPYFASAMNHALNRRKFLRSKIDWSPRGNIDFVARRGVPVLYRSDARSRLCPSRYTRVGRKVYNDDLHRVDRTVELFFKGLPSNELPVSDRVVSVQPVAPDAKRERRAVRLDI